MAKSKHTKSSKSWLDEHHNDPYVARSKIDGYRSRASYKLIELQQKDKLFKPGMSVVDLGAAPGGWSQILTGFVGQNGQVFALDILEMDPLSGVHFIQGDFTEDEPYEALLDMTSGKQIDWVISDMAPNMSGNKTTDQARAMHLVELAFDFAEQALTKKGNFLAKIFQGEGFDAFIQNLRQRYQKVIIRKPEASRARSSEVYVIAFCKKDG